MGNTRGDKVIDRIFSNMGRSVLEAGSYAPLETEDGRVSDHRVAYGRFKLKCTDGRLTLIIVTPPRQKNFSRCGLSFTFGVRSLRLWGAMRRLEPTNPVSYTHLTLPTTPYV